ncbi:hypothetical protein CC80DRAFT_404324 [Byssothecium circinans]|uniref:Uncharacterized protein n=1 Tax=Byssothecium circinans TaxID=147558 RepID=A0A6A5U684_9PLEO|nr:hypothetical protein CC80DRAFT_404324 [Byssothecium circinans]
MTTYLRRTKPHSTGLAVSAAELGVTKQVDAEPAKGNRGSSRDRDKPSRNCVCGKKHWYADCFILNPRHLRRPKDYRPTAEMARKVEEAQKDPKINARIKTALKK